MYEQKTKLEIQSKISLFLDVGTTADTQAFQSPNARLNFIVESSRFQGVSGDPPVHSSPVPCMLHERREL